MKHTELPWVKLKNNRIQSEVGGVVLSEDGFQYGEAEANAALIVKAVNNHEKLLSALKLLYKNCEASGKYLDNAAEAIKEAEL